MKLINNLNLRNCSGFSFGYNKEYHRTLEKQLNSYKTPIAKHIARSDSVANDIENDVVALENSKKPDTDTFDSLTKTLVALRALNAYNISANFNNLGHVDKLIEQYISEMTPKNDSYKNHWRRDLCVKLCGYTLKKHDVRLNELACVHGIAPMVTASKMDNKKPNKEKDIGPSTTLDEISQQAVDDYINSRARELLVKFNPQKSSARGFTDVFGLDKIKEKLKEDIIDYVKNPQLELLDYYEYGITRANNFLFYGPPGCGKTYIIEAMAQESGLDMYKMDVSKLGSSYVNKTATNIQEAFESLSKIAKNQGRPVILFMDEVDSLAITRNKTQDTSENLKTTTTLLKHIQEARDNNILVFAATNKYDLLDDAFVSRFDERDFFGVFNEEEIVEYIKKSFKDVTKARQLLSDEAALKILAHNLYGHSNRSISFILRDAAKMAKKNNRSDITFEIMQKAIEDAPYEKPNERNYLPLDKRKKTIGYQVSIN